MRNRRKIRVRRWCAGTGGLSLILAAAVWWGVRFFDTTTAETAARLGLTPQTYVVPGEPSRTITYYSVGEPDKPRIIYVHGTPGSARVWERYLFNPFEGYETIAIDRPGFGDSQPRGAVVSLREQARAIEPLLVERDGRWPILVGYSMGGPIVARVAADYPDKVDSIVIVAGALDPELEKVHPLQRLANTLVVSPLLPRHLRNANKELLPLRRELKELAGHLENVTRPVVIVHGTDDAHVPYDNVEFMTANFANAERLSVMTLVGKNHFLPRIAEDEVRAAIAEAAAAIGDIVADGIAPATAAWSNDDIEWTEIND